MSFYDPKISPALPFSSQVFLAKSIRLCYDQINDLGHKFRRLFFWLFRLRKQTDPGSTSLGSKTLRHRHRGAQNLRGTAHRSGRDLQRLLLLLFDSKKLLFFPSSKASTRKFTTSPEKRWRKMLPFPRTSGSSKLCSPPASSFRIPAPCALSKTMLNFSRAASAGSEGRTLSRR